MDLSKYKIKLNIKACCMYEQMSGKSFFECNTEDDAVLMMYCSLIVNNDILFPFSTFKILIKTNKKVEAWLLKEYETISRYSSQFNKDETAEEGEGTENKMNVTMTDMANSLIVQYKVDAHYVMYDMDLWEIMSMFKAADNVKKEDLEEKRLWTYLTIAPHIDGKKVKGPEDLLSFPWEKDTKKERALKDLENKKDLINRILGGNKNG